MLLERLFHAICDGANIDYESRMQDENVINICNVIVYITGIYMQEILDVHTRNINMPEDQRPKITMKSEFLFKRLMLTSNKKQYAGIVLVREGKVFKEPKIDLKGLSIKKVSTNINTRNYFMDVIKNNILDSKDSISTKQILNDFYSYESDLLDGLNNHKVEFLLPAKYGTFESYALPWRVMAVKAVKLWNSIYPEDEIQDYEKVRIAKLNIPRFETIEDDENIPQHIRDVIKQAVFENEAIQHLGAAVIALPMSHKELPQWLIPYLNNSLMVSDNLNAAMPIFEAMELQVTKYKQKKYMTNMLPISITK